METNVLESSEPGTSSVRAQQCANDHKGILYRCPTDMPHAGKVLMEHFSDVYFSCVMGSIPGSTI
jgi:hypothetical protein